MRLPLLAVIALVAAPLAAVAQTTPPAIFTDPATDAKHPASMTVLHIPSHGENINGLIYAPPGAGRHPTVILCHGLPGNEKNLDLAQAIRRAGWNAVTFNYRGSWGSPGQFRFAQNPEDAAAVLAYLRDAKNAERLGIDTGKIVIAGHSMGGWVAAMTGSSDPDVKGVVLISAADMGGLAAVPREKLVGFMADDMESLAGVTAESMADEVLSNAQAFGMTSAAAGLTKKPMLALTSDDGLAPNTAALVAAIKASGGTQITATHVATDHSWSDRRIALESAVLRWLAKLP